ncbi:MAG: MarR family transcriptional regulator [Eubacteriales bacterium]|nr:MarR family transcriptional regulator [Eubacteriales bacterium]
MAQATEFLINLRHITKLHELCLRDICSRYHLTMMEATIIGFLKNNPGLDTAADIVELRMLSKGHVSQAVESLIQKSLLSRTVDPEDRRRIHLSLLPESNPVTESLEQIQNVFLEELFDGFTPAERRQFGDFNRRIMENSKKSLEKRRHS